MRKKSPSPTRCSNNKRVHFIPSLRRGAATVFHWSLGLALLPLLWAAFRELTLMIPVLGKDGFQGWWLYALGIIFYLAFDRIVTQPMSMYVFGHELTHVISGLMTGAKVHSFKATAKGGEVRLSKTNTFISLSPYIIPIYSLIAILLYWILQHWWNPPQLLLVFQFLMGSTLAFHLVMTMRAIHTRQPDLKGRGLFLSTILIALGNALIVTFILIALFARTPSFKNYGLNLYHDTTKAWSVTIRTAAALATRATPWIRSLTR